MFEAIILGIIEGLTEFLPVSSTGHLIIANRYLSFEGAFANLFAVVIQAGAILAVFFYFKDKIFPKLSTKDDVVAYGTMWSKVVVGIIPAALIGIPFEDVIEKYLFNPITVAIALIVGAFMLIFFDRPRESYRVVEDINITYKDAFLVGVFQCMALVPGMSRSASTIIGGLIVGFNRKVAAEFSFFLAIPTILGAALLKLVKAGFDFSSYEWLLLFIGTFVSFVTAYVVIALFMEYIKKRDLKPFAYYRIVLGIIVLLFAR